MNDSNTEETVKEISRQLQTALNGYVFEPSPEMLEKRFIDRVAEVVGGHVHEIAKAHMKVFRVGDETILELGKPMMDIVRTVYGNDLVAILAPNSTIKLPGWRKPDQCGSLNGQEQTISVPLPDVPEEKREPKAVRTRPRSRRLWQAD